MPKFEVVPILELVRETPTTMTYRFRGDFGGQPGQFLMVWIPRYDELPMAISYLGAVKGITVHEQEFLRVLRAGRGDDPGSLLREGLDRGDHGGHPAPAADREDGLAFEPKHVSVRPADADPVARVECREDVRRVAVVADRDALHRAEVRQGHRELVIPRDPHHQELPRLAAEIRAKSVRHRRRCLSDDLEERDDLDPRHGRPRSPQVRS